MPLFDYVCKACGRPTEVFVRDVGRTPPEVPCAWCGSAETARTVSRFAFKSFRPAKYSEEFRERASGFLQSRPGAEEVFAAGGESEEAKVYKLTESIGERIDAALERRVFRNLPGP